MTAVRFSNPGIPLDIACALAAGRHDVKFGTVHDPLRAKLGDAWPLVRARAVKALGQIDDPKDLNVLWDLRRDRDPRVRMEVILALRNGGRIDTALEEALNMPNRAFDGRKELLIKQAEEAVTDIQREDLRRALDELRRDLDQWIRFDLDGTIAGLCRNDALLLRRVLAFLCSRVARGVSGNELPTTRCNFGSPWWPMNLPEAFARFAATFPETVEEALEAPSPPLVAALGETGDRRWAPLLRPWLSSRNGDLQATTAEAMGQLRDEVSIPELRKLLGSPKVGVALAAMTSLCRMLGDLAATDFAAYLRRVPDRDLRQIFESVEASEGVLRAALASPRAAVRSLAAEFLDPDS